MPALCKAERETGSGWGSEGFDQLCVLVSGLRQLQQQQHAPKRSRTDAPTINLCESYLVDSGDGGVLIQRLLSSVRRKVVLPGHDVPAYGGAAAKQVRMASPGGLPRRACVHWAHRASPLVWLRPVTSSSSTHGRRFAYGPAQG